MKIKRIFLIIIIILSCIFGFLLFYKRDKISFFYSTKMNVVLSLEDKITDNSIWCGTFNLIWNDLKNDLAKQDIIFNPQLDIVNNLNKGTFNTNYLNENSYYKIYGNPTIELKNKIEKAIKDKFNETSDVLDDFNWNNNDKEDYFLYVMLKKDFKFNKEFTKVNNYKFKDKENISFFGIDKDTAKEVREQVEVLYYENDNDFAIKLLTTTDDEVILIKGNNKVTFLDVYNDLKEKNNSFNDNKKINDDERVLVPNINLKIKKEISEVENKEFKFSNNKSYIIDKALQTIEFKLDKEGGKVKSEAAMSAKATSSVSNYPKRSFVLDDTFILMLKEKDKDLPYLAFKISNIENIQDIVK